MYRKIDAFNCVPRNACYTFCESSNYEKFPDEILKKNFPFDNFGHFENGSEYLNNYKIGIVKNEVECHRFFKKEIISDYNEFIIRPGGYMIYNPNPYFSKDKYEYCLQPYEVNNNLRVRLVFCTSDYVLVYTIRIFLTIITAIFIIIPITVYSTFKEIRKTLNGKLCIAFALSQIYMIFIMPRENFDLHYIVSFLIFLAGLFSTCFIVSLMCFDIFLTLKHFREPQIHSKYLKISVYIWLILFIVVFILAYFNHHDRYEEFYRNMYYGFSETILIICGIIMIINFLVLICSIYYLISLTKSPSLAKNTRFDLENERFWLYIKLFIITSITWFIEFDSSWYREIHDSNIVGDILMCFSAAICSYLLIFTPCVYSLVFKKNNFIKNDEIENNLN